MRAYDLAQLNVGRLVAAEDSAVVAEFIDALDEINALADAWPGFIWRFQTDDGNAIAERPFPDDALMLVNFSTWESLEALAEYVFRSRHADFLRRRREWHHGQGAGRERQRQISLRILDFAGHHKRLWQTM